MNVPIGIRSREHKACHEMGVETLEFLGFFPFFLVAGLIAGQLLVAGHAMLTTAEAARHGARALAAGTSAFAAVSAAVDPYELADLRAPPCEPGEPAEVTVSVTVPFLTIPLTDFGREVTTTATAMFRCEPRS